MRRMRHDLSHEIGAGQSRRLPTFGREKFSMQRARFDHLMNDAPLEGESQCDQIGQF